MSLSKKEEIGSLFRRYLNNECTLEEAAQLLAYVDAGENEQVFKQLIEEHLEAQGTDERNEAILDVVSRKLSDAIAAQEFAKVSRARPALMRKGLWYKLSAAAAVLFVITAFGYYVINNGQMQSASHRPVVVPALESDVQPGIQSALLTLDNGSVINLDERNNGTLVQLPGVTILKEDNNIIYKKSVNGNASDTPVYTTVSTLRGNEYQLTLQDGTRVWLNAESSIRFPTVFKGNERRVVIRGEAYFEVAKMPAKPFKVDIESAVGRGEIEVLGTHFNVSAYPDDKEVRTTLLEGSVKISKSNETKILRPGEQAQYDQEKLRVTKRANVEEATAWKNGFFAFDNTDIKQILQEVARWYNVAVVYENTGLTGDGFTGKISKSLPLSKFLEVLELNGIDVRMEGKKVIVGSQ